MSKLFIPFLSTNIDGPKSNNPYKPMELGLMEEYSDVYPGPQNCAIPRRSLSAITTPALTGKCLGCASFRTLDGVTDMVFAGDATKLYRAFSTVTTTFTFSDISKGGGYSTATGETWEFAMFARASGEKLQRVIATNFTNDVQTCDIRASVTHTFSDLILTGTKIKARHLGIIGQFLILGNTKDDVTSASVNYTPSRLHWSAFGNPTAFLPLASTQCDFEDLQTGGAVQKIVGGTEYGLIVQERQVQVMRYVGGTTIFDFSPLDYVPGTPIPNSVIAYGGAVYFISAEGFIALRGTEIQRIGKDLIDEYFWTTVEVTRFHEISVAVDYANKLIIWGFPFNTDGVIKRVLVYRIEDGRWARWFPASGSTGVEVFANIRQGLGRGMFIAFDTAHKLCTFTGTAVPFRFETKALQPVPGRRWQCNGARIIMDNSGVGATHTGTIDATSSDNPHPVTTPSTITAVNLNPDNYFPCRIAGRFIRFNITLTPLAANAPTTHYMGMELDYEVLGER